MVKREKHEVQPIPLTDIRLIGGESARVRIDEFLRVLNAEAASHGVVLSSQDVATLSSFYRKKDLQHAHRTHLELVNRTAPLLKEAFRKHCEQHGGLKGMRPEDYGIYDAFVSEDTEHGCFKQIVTAVALVEGFSPGVVGKATTNWWLLALAVGALILASLIVVFWDR